MATATQTEVPYGGMAYLRKMSVEEYEFLVKGNVLGPDDNVELLEGYMVLKRSRGHEHDFALQELADRLYEMVPNITPLTTAASFSGVRGRCDRRPGSGRTSTPAPIATPRGASEVSAGRHFFGAATPHVLEEGVRQQYQGGVMVPPPPRPALEVVQAEFVLQFTVAVLDPPAALRRGH